jgi:hypothetical protein
MVNYLNILGLWDIVQYGYIPHYDPSNLTMTQNVKELKSQNDYAVNVILNSVNEKIAKLFGTTKIVLSDFLLNNIFGQLLWRK